jgi:predicted nucleic acid-binding protein
MNVLIDTNVILDILLRRDPHYENAARINVLSEKGYIRSYISASAATDIFYVVKKELKDKDRALELFKKLLITTRIASVTEAGIHEALELKWDDFEDAVQYVAGQNISAEYIITRNPKDFAGSEITVLSPGEFLNQITI